MPTTAKHHDELGSIERFPALVNRSFFIRMLWCIAPLGAAFMLPAALALWVESHCFQHPIADAFQAVIADYSQTQGDGLWVMTFYQLPPFLLLAGVLVFFTRRLTALSVATLSLLGLALICLAQIPMAINVLKDIPEGEAEFIEFRYVFISVLSSFLLCFLYFPLLALRSNAVENA